jgi:polar amino acid transport system substrate-binding protein
MRFVLIIGAAAALLIGASAPTTAGDALDRIIRGGVMIDAVDEEYPPFSFRDSKGDMAGFDIDIAGEVARRLGVKLKVVTPGWNRITAGGWNGRWDISIGSMAPTNERARALDFPAIYYYAVAVLVAHRDNATFQKAEDLSGRRVGVRSGSAAERYLRQTLTADALGMPPTKYRIDHPQIIGYDSELLGLKDLAQGDGARLDGMVADLLAATQAIEDGRPLKLVGAPLFYAPLVIAVDKGDPALGRDIAAIIAGMRADGTLKRLSEQRLGADVTTPPSGD